VDSRKIGFLLALPPSHTSAESVHGLAHAALDAGHAQDGGQTDAGAEELVAVLIF